MGDEEAARKAHEAAVEIQAVAYRGAAAYTNLILLGGYAGAIAIWAYTRDQFPPKATILIAFLLALSLVTFITFEVYKMIITTRVALKKAKLLREGLSPQTFLQRLQGLEREYDRYLLKTILRVWAVTTTIAVATALAAVLIGFVNFFSILLGYAGWPVG